MSNQPKSGRIDKIIKLLLMFFISLLSFSVGLFVGKSVSESSLRASVPQKNEDSKESLDEESAESTDGEKAAQNSEDGEISDEEISRLTEEYVGDLKKSQEEGDRSTASVESKEEASTQDGFKKFEATENEEKSSHSEPPQTPASHGEDKHETKASHSQAEKNSESKDEHKSQADLVPLTKTSERLVENKSPNSTPQASDSTPDVQLPEVTTSSIGKYTVQVGSYPKELEAQNYASELKKQGFSAFYITAKVNGQNWYRVNIGLFSDSQSAKEFKQNLLKQKRMPSALVQKITK